MPGYEGSGESKVAAEITITEYFAGNDTVGQSFTLLVPPLLPLTLEIYNSTKQRWDLVRKENFTSVGNVITFSAIQKAPAPASAYAEDRNVRITYLPTPDSLGGADKALIAESEAGTPLELRGAAPTGYLNLEFSPNTGKGKITNINITRVAQNGTAYTLNSRQIEIFRIAYDPGSPPTSDGQYSKFLTPANLEPSAGGKLFSASSVTLGEIQIENLTITEFGYIGVVMTALGGAADSEEDYHILIEGEELK